MTENFYQVKISFGFFKIDSWNDEKALFFIDSVKIGDRAFSMYDGTDICGQIECSNFPSPYCNKDMLANIDLSYSFSNKTFNFSIET